MKNMFAMFDPSALFNLNLNWIGMLSILIFFPSSYWLGKSKFYYLLFSIISYLNKEFSMAMSNLKTPGLTHLLLSLFLFIVMINFLSLFPYIFSVSSHLSFSMTLAIPIWVGYMTYSTIINLDTFIAHLVPLSTPYLLMPFMVMIEIISNLIRPVALSIRLTANMIAGHTLIAVLSIPVEMSSNTFIYMVLIMTLFLLFMLEMGVSFVQGYVFSSLTSMFIIDCNAPNL